jgi:hypothetical protein
MARTPKLNDLQLILLSTASARDGGNVFPLAECIAHKPAEVAKAITALLKRSLVIEYPETVLVRVWREVTEQRIGLAITDAGRALIDGGEQGTTGAAAATVAAPATPPAAEAPSPAPRTGSKTEAVLELLSRTDGATSAELIEATGWQPHTTRAALTGLRKKGHAIERTKRSDQTCYRIPAQG